MTSNQNIQCPLCQMNIPFRVNELLMGIHFACSGPDCNASISLAGESKSIVQETMDKLKEIETEIA